MSDGTAALRFLDPVTFAEKRRVMVTDGGLPVPHLNELEFVKGEIYANIWQTNLIARIDPGSGVVVGWIDLTGLLSLADSARRRRPERHRLRRRARSAVRHRQALAQAVRDQGSMTVRLKPDPSRDNAAMLEHDAGVLARAAFARRPARCRAAVDTSACSARRRSPATS